MPEELRLPAVAAAVLLWCLLRALRQLRSTLVTSPIVVWREAIDDDWSEWTELDGMPASVGHHDMLAEVRRRADEGVTAVQFAVVAQPADAPEYTLRILYMSAVCKPAGRELNSVGCGGVPGNA